MGLVKGHHVTDGRTDCPIGGGGDEDLKAVIQQVCSELIIFYHFKEKSVLKSYFQIDGWTPERLDRAGVALIERGDTSLTVYGRTHFLVQEDEKYDEFAAAAAAFGDAATEDVRNELGALKSADSGCGAIPTPLIILGVIGAAALTKICINETVAYIEARTKPTYPGGKTFLLHFCVCKK